MPITSRRGAICLLGGAGLMAAAGPVMRPARRDLYLCDGCQAVRERSPASLPSRLRLAPRGEPGTPMLLTGRAFTPDGRPAANVVVYAHHTDARGLYSRGSNETEWSKRHGLLRGWVRTDAQGQYAFETIKPAPYPNRDMPAHVHLFIGEAGHRPYYIDDVVFDGEFGVTPTYRTRQEFRGGSGIVRLRKRPDGSLLAVRDIVLERHPA